MRLKPLRALLPYPPRPRIWSARGCWTEGNGHGRRRGGTMFREKPLRKDIFDFAGGGESGIGIETDKVGEMIHAGNVAVGEHRFDGVLVPASSLVLLQGGAIEESFERRRAELDAE